MKPSRADGRRGLPGRNRHVRGVTLLELAVVLTLTALTFPLIYRFAADFHRAWVGQREQKAEWQREILFRQRLSLALLRSGGVWDVSAEGFRFVDSTRGLTRFPPERSGNQNPFDSIGPTDRFLEGLEFRWDLDTGSAPQDPFGLDDFFADPISDEIPPDRVPEADAWKRFDANRDGRVAEEELLGVRLVVLAWRPKAAEENAFFEASPTEFRPSGPRARRNPSGFWKVFYWFPRARLNPTLQPDEDFEWGTWP